MTKERDVIVLDASRQFLEYAHPAIARKLLKDGKASVYSREPFAIQMHKSVENPDRHRRSREIMAQVTNFTEFFREERDIYVQNVSNCQVSVIFDVGGHTESFLFPNSKDPVNLTRFIPFAAIKGSMDLRRMLNRAPPALQLLNEQEYRMYFENQAQKQGLKGADQAIDRAEVKRQAIQNHMPLPDAPDPIKLHNVVQDGQHLGEKKIVQPTEQVSEEEEINPKVLNLCLQMHPSIPDQQKMSAAQVLQEIDLINGLSLIDWEYVQSHGYYKTVKNFARRKISELASEPEIVVDMAPAATPTTEPVKVAAKAKPAKKVVKKQATP